MKKIMKKSTNVILSLALILTLNAAIVIPATSGDAFGISPMSDADPVTNFYI